MIIAVDGPAGAGKSTVCRALAKELSYTYLDTGAMYRAVAWALLHNGGNAEVKLEDLLPRLPLEFVIERGSLAISFRGQELDEELRPPEITERASSVSQLASVRAFLTRCQRRLAVNGQVVAEGRDMTTVVFPDAPVKVFLTADLATRALRRQKEFLSKGIPLDISQMEAQIQARDAADEQRSLAPLRPAEDALVLDTSKMQLSEVINSLKEFVQDKIKSGVCAL